MLIQCAPFLPHSLQSRRRRPLGGGVESIVDEVGFDLQLKRSFNSSLDSTELEDKLRFHNCNTHNNHLQLVSIPFCNSHIRKNIDRHS